MYIQYTAAFHMKYKHLFANDVYDSDRIATHPLIITWAEIDMAGEDGNNQYLAVSAKTPHYDDRFKVTEEFFEDALQAYFLFPDINDDDKDSSKLRLEFVKALLNK